MNIRKISVVFILFVFTLIQLCYAHSPSKIEVNYDDVTGMLNVTVMHSVENPENHYVKTIKILHNDNTIVEQDFMIQNYTDSQKAIYIIPGVKKGDTINIEAYCSKTGEKEKEIKIE